MNRVYKISCFLLQFVIWIIFPTRVTGRENIPEGGAIVCANHSDYLDPILLALAFGPKHCIHFMAKIELFKTRFLSWLIRTYGGFSVDRGKNDINSIRMAMKYLKTGEKIGIFPEGTRSSEDDEGEGKSGTVRLAAKMKVPVVPVYITRNKKPFRRVNVNIGEPCYIDQRPGENTDELSAGLMRKIFELKE